MAFITIPEGLKPHIRRFGWSGLVALVVIGFMLAGINPVTLITGQVSPPPALTSITGMPGEKAETADLETYVKIVAAEADELWKRTFYLAAIAYPPGKISTSVGDAAFGCGMTGSGAGTFYCPEDDTIYVDLTVYERLRQQFPGAADYAQAFQVANAYGHHVQNSLDELSKFAGERAAMTPEAVTAREQLLGIQATCYAAVWTKTAGMHELLWDANIVDAIDTAEAFARPVAMPSRAGFEVPETFERPDFVERQAWFEKGYDIPAGGTCKLEKIEAERGAAS